MNRNKEGVQAVINTLKLKGKNLIEICTFNLNHVKRSSRTWNNFQFKLTEFDQWLEKIMQEQIKQNNSMGQNIEEVSFFLKSTKELLGHVQVVMKSDTNTTFRVRVNFFYNSQFFVENYPLLCLWGDSHFAKVIFFKIKIFF